MTADFLAALGYRAPAWQADAACREHPDIDFHTRGKAEQQRALQVCGRCLVRAECLSWALADKTLLGVLGGTDERARNVIRRNRERF